jgi:hypothetical protein
MELDTAESGCNRRIHTTVPSRGDVEGEKLTATENCKVEGAQRLICQGHL